MKYTDKLNLNKPELQDYVNIEDLNENMDTIDGEFKNIDGEITAANRKITNNEKKITAANRKITNNEKKITAVEDDMSKIGRRVTGEHTFDYNFWAEDITLNIPVGDIDGMKNFRVTIQGSLLENQHLGVLVQGRSGVGEVVHCIGSFAVSPSDNVTERYNTVSAWSVRGMDGDNRDINRNDPIVGTSTFENRGIGNYKNEFTSCLVSGKSINRSTGVFLTGIYLRGTNMHFQFYRNNSSIRDIEICPKITYEIW